MAISKVREGSARPLPGTRHLPPSSGTSSATTRATDSSCPALSPSSIRPPPESRTISSSTIPAARSISRCRSATAPSSSTTRWFATRPGSASIAASVPPCTSTRTTSCGPTRSDSKSTSEPRRTTPHSSPTSCPAMQSTTTESSTRPARTGTWGIRLASSVARRTPSGSRPGPLRWTRELRVSSRARISRAGHVPWTAIRTAARCRTSAPWSSTRIWTVMES